MRVLLLVVVAHGPVAGGQVLVTCGAVVVAGLAGGLGFGVGADGAQGGVEGAEPGEPELFSDVTGCPGGLGGVAVGEQPQPPVGHGTDLRPACWAEGDEGLVPGGALVRGLVAGFGTDRVAGMVIAVHLTVRRNGGGLACPIAAGG